MKKRFSLVLPVFNEENVISNSIDDVYKKLNGTKIPFEIIIGDDGSTDSSPEIISLKVNTYRNISVIKNKERKGKAAILKRCFKETEGGIVGFMDSDLYVKKSMFTDSIRIIDNGADLVIASKHMNSYQGYGVLRRVLSQAYAFAARILLGVNISDFQCGFKVFRRELILEICDAVKNEDWSWDTEIVLYAVKKGYRVIEIPARINEIPLHVSKINIWRASFLLGFNLFKLWLRSA